MMIPGLFKSTGDFDYYAMSLILDEMDVPENKALHIEKTVRVIEVIQKLRMKKESK